MNVKINIRIKSFITVIMGGNYIDNQHSAKCLAIRNLKTHLQNGEWSLTENLCGCFYIPNH